MSENVRFVVPDAEARKRLERCLEDAGIRVVDVMVSSCKARGVVILEHDNLTDEARIEIHRQARAKGPLNVYVTVSDHDAPMLNAFICGWNACGDLLSGDGLGLEIAR